MNKKLIALLLVVALACSGVFAMGFGVMGSDQSGYGVTYAPSKGGLYYGLGWKNNGIGFSAEKNILKNDFFDADIFSFGYQLGFGANVCVDFVNTFDFGAGIYGLLGLHVDINVIPKLGIEIFGQWQPNIYFTFLPAFTPNFYNWFAGHAYGFRFWF